MAYQSFKNFIVKTGQIRAVDGSLHYIVGERYICPFTNETKYKIFRMDVMCEDELEERAIRNDIVLSDV
jgi:hypothetical protein